MTTQKLSLLLLNVTLTLFGPVSAGAVVVPDAGETLRQIQKQIIPPPIKTDAPDIKLEEKTPSSQANNDKTPIPVQSFHITGSTVFAESELNALVDDLKGASHTLAELQDGAARITAYYHLHGYPVARAYLPAQDIQNGLVTIAVLEGQVGQVRLTNQARISDERAQNYLSAIKPEALVQSKPLDRALLLLSDTPGVGAARATLQPGASAGSSDVLIDLKPSDPYSGSVGLDNYGSHYTGQYRLNGQLTVNSPFKLGDQLNLNIVQSNANLSYGRVAWQLPVGNDGLTLGAAFAGTHYRLGEEFSNLKAHGSATVGSLIATYPFLRTPTTNVFGIFSFEEKRLKDDVDGTTPATSSNKRLEQVNIGVVGQHLDHLGQGGVTSFDANISLGRLHINLPDTLAIDQATVRTNGDFARLALTVKRFQQVSERHSVSVQISGQAASKNLNSSEKFSLGGINGVKAYPEGEGLGDEGILANVSWNIRLAEYLQGSLFYDAGSVKVNYDASLVGGENRRTLSGAGLGLDAQLAKIRLKSYVAWRTSGGEANAGPEHNPRLWTQASLPF